MTRIRIDDLPIAEHFTPEEEEQILGAGRPSFRPMLESLEAREMYTANVTASLTAGVLNVQGAHIQNTPQDDRVAIRLIQNQIQVLNGPNNEMVKSFDKNQVQKIDILMSRGNALVDLTGLGRMSSEPHNYIRTDEGTADVLYLNQAG